MLTKEQKAKLRAAYDADVWHGNDRMTDFCTNEAAELAELPNGDFIPVEKKKIETNFCYGESGYDYDEAAAAAAHARTSTEHFKRENMEHFTRELAQVEDQYKLHSEEAPELPDWVFLIREHPYIGQPETSHLKGAQAYRWHEVLDALGGSAHVRELPGAKITLYGSTHRVPTLAELDAIKAAYERAAAEHAKKVDRYLKRYGLSKVHAWTYWRDA